MNMKRFGAALSIVLAASASGTAFAADSVFQSQLVQPPSIGNPERGSVAGTLASLSFGPAEMSRGSFHLSLPLGSPTDRGPLLAGVTPTYSPEAGIGELGAGWSIGVRIHRTRSVGDIDFVTDDWASPWGTLKRGDDGAWYPVGLSTRARMVEGAGRVTVTDGSGTTFVFAKAVTNNRGTYAYYLTEVTSALGERTVLAYETNATGRPYLHTVDYGGRSVLGYRIELVYDDLVTKLDDFRSGARQSLDRRVREIQTKVRAGLDFTVRSSLKLAYTNSDSGPAFYLTGVTKAYASGATEPPLEYRYDSRTDTIANATFADVPALNAYLVQAGNSGLLPSTVTATDVDDDGLVDLEHRFQQELLHQSPDGSFTAVPLGPEPADIDRGCRPQPNNANAPRVLARMTPEAVEPHVVTVAFDGANGASSVRVCNRLGSRLATKAVPGDWRLSALTRLVDVNRDGRPDLVRLSGTGIAVLLNRGLGETDVWEAMPFLPLPGGAFDTLWAHDMNGDGLVDLVGRSSTGTVVWYGLGGGAFAPAGEPLVVRTSAGAVLTNLTGFDLSFLDVNRDGLADVLLTKPGSAGGTLLVHRGRHAVPGGGDRAELGQISLPALAQVAAGTLFPTTAEVDGSSEHQIVFTVNKHARALRLTRPSTGLMLEASDGKGTRVTFDYGRAASTPGLRTRPVVLASMTIAAGGDDPRTQTYAYLSPKVHSENKSLLGFGDVTRSNPLALERAAFEHDDDLTGIVVASETHDTRQPLIRSTNTIYDEALFHGVRFKRPLARDERMASTEGAVVGTARTDYLEYQRGTCATHTIMMGRHGTVETERVLASVSGLVDELHCLSTTESMLGTHADSSLDFGYEVLVDRNARGQVTKVTQGGGEGPLVLQEVSYDGLGRAETTSAPGRGLTRFFYDADTNLLNRSIAPDGSAVGVTSRAPLTDRPLEVLAERGGGVTYATSFRYDALERLERKWDDLAPGASESSPLESMVYAFGTFDRPGRIESKRRLAAGANAEEKSLFSADGDAIASVHRIPTGWASSDARRMSRNLGEAIALRRAAFPASTDFASLGYSGVYSGASSELAFERAATLGPAPEIRLLVQSGVSQAITSTAVVTGGAVVATTTENGTRVVRNATDEAGKVLWTEDAAGARTENRYDALGRLVEVRLPGGAVQRQRFDGYGRPAFVEHPGIGRIEYRYDPVTGLPTVARLLDADGAIDQTSTTVNDALGRPATVTESRGTSLKTFAYQYDGLVPGQPVIPGQLGVPTRVSGPGFEKKSVYRRDGKPSELSLTIDGFRTVTRSFDYFDDGSPKSQRWTVRDAAGTIRHDVFEQTELDAVGRPKAVRIGGAIVAQLAYDGEGRLETIALPGGTRHTVRYDAATQAPNGYDQTGGDNPGSVRWSKNARGEVESESFVLGGALSERTYVHDERGFLTRVNGPTKGAPIAAYAYDTSGLFTEATDHAGARSFERNGSLLDVGGVRYVFDRAGRVSKKGDLSLEYGADGELARASRPNGTAFRFVHDETGERIAKTDDAGAVLAAYLDGSYLTDTTFVLPLRIAGQLVGVVENGAFRSVLADARGTLLADGPDTSLPTPYGLRAARPRLTAALDYVEKAYDADLESVRMGARDFDPYLGQFRSPDPLYLQSLDKCAGSAVDCNLYSYGRNSPLRFTDPSGLEPKEEETSRSSESQPTYEADNASGGVTTGPVHLSDPFWKPVGDAFALTALDVLCSVMGCNTVSPAQSPGGAEVKSLTIPELAVQAAATLTPGRLGGGAFRAIAAPAARSAGAGAGGKLAALDADAVRNLSGLRRSGVLPTNAQLIVGPNVVEEVGRHGISPADLASAGIKIAPGSPLGASVAATRIADVLRGFGGKGAASAASDGLNLAEAAGLGAEAFVTKDKQVLRAFGGMSQLPGTGGTMLHVIGF